MTCRWCDTGQPAFCTEKIKASPEAHKAAEKAEAADLLNEHNEEDR